MPRSDDIVSAFMRCVRELHPATPTAELLRMEALIRREWGGKARYILKATPPVPEHQPGGAGVVCGVRLQA